MKEELRKHLQKEKRKNGIFKAVASAAIVTCTLASMKLAGFSVLDKISKIKEKSVPGGNTTVYVADDGAIVCDSIVQGVRDCNLADGNYTFRVTGNTDGTSETKDYPVELINYTDDVHYTLADGETSTTISLGDTTTDYKMLVVKYHKNLTIDKGVTVTATNVNNLTYKKGMYLCVLGDLVNNGTISMTARGTYNCDGENVYLWKNTDDTYEYIPANGAAKKSEYRPYYETPKLDGNNGTNRGTGSGGLGNGIVNGLDGSNNSYVGSSTGGTSYAGGNGSGSIVRCNSSAVSASYSQASKLKGGDGSAWDAGRETYYFAGAGAGTTGGNSSYCRLGTGNTETKASDGTGGLLLVYTKNLENAGIITSNGSNGAGAECSLYGRYRGAVGGGGSGGGSVNIFYKYITKIGELSAKGGNGGDVSKCTNANMGIYNGGNGGDGSVTLTKVLPDLIYSERNIELNVNESIKIDKNKLKFNYTNPSSSSTSTTIGDIKYKAMDSIIEVDDLGNITAKKIGKTKLKITDITNDISTYIYITVKDGSVPDVKNGKNFTIALKSNGTVWSYGLNTNGQLGIGNNTDENVPVKIEELSNIKKIATGYSHSLALKEDGTVYAWGEGTKGQLGDGNNTDSNVPVKVDGLSNIIKIDAYKNMSMALDKDGKVYVWGEGYSTLPMKVVFSEKIEDISGTLMLTKLGTVYDLSDTSKAIDGLYNIAKISCGEAHNLALTTDGIAYAWGTNTYGECYTKLAENNNIIAIEAKIFGISAGNQTSFLLTDDKKVYVLGNNSNGQIGLGTTKNATELTLLNLSSNIETISAGEGTHSSLVAEDGFVWNSGTNTNGELGTGDATSKTEFSQIGSTIITTNFEKKYLDKNESTTIVATLENTFNLKQDIIDSNQDDFTVTLSNDTAFTLNNKSVTAMEYGNTIATISHNKYSTTKKVEIISAMKMESIVQGFRDANLADGNYTVVVNDQEYDVELINYYDDVHYTLADGETSTTISLGDTTTDYKTLVVKYHKNLTIDKGVTVTATNVDNLTYKKGMYLCVLGDVENNGTISMTARGTSADGENVFLWKNIDNTYEYIPANGASGIEERKTDSQIMKSTKGNDGTNRETGGGGQSGAIINGNDGSWNSYIGSSTGGTSYAGGNGSGAIVRCNTSGVAADVSAATKTTGGNASVYDTNSNSQYYGGGSAGITGGSSSYCRISNSGLESKGQDGVGGLLVLYTNKLSNNGEISSKGSNGAGGSAYNYNTTYVGNIGGAGSGGGSVNIFVKTIESIGNCTAAGGLGGVIKANNNSMGNIVGGAGGDGTVTINELGSVLNYSKKTVNLTENSTYQIDKSKLSYTKLNDIQTKDLTVGDITYESNDTSIATVDSNGNITALKKGKTKIKITDTTNNYSTYIIVNVTKDGQVVPMIREGNEFTIALKSNGTVWGYGLNTNGQLGNNSLENSNEPVQVIDNNGNKLQNITQIGTGTSNAIALNNSGDVYTWGLNDYIVEKEVQASDTDNTTPNTTNGNSANETTNTVTEDEAVSENILKATKVANLSNIEYVNAYKNNFYAINNNGELFVWGENYKEITKIDTAVAISKIDNELLLGENGKIYKLSDPTKSVDYINEVCDISSSENHYLALTLNGRIYSFGNNESGQLGNLTNTDSENPTLVKTSDGNILENVIEISAGKNTSMCITEDGTAYGFGNNKNSNLGITANSDSTSTDSLSSSTSSSSTTTSTITAANYATKITSVNDISGDTIDLPKFELVETSDTNSTLMDENGFVYTVGINKNGNLGTSDNIDRTIFTKIGKIDITSNPKNINVTLNKSKDIAIYTANSFNLKTDMAESTKLTVTNMNSKGLTLEEYKDTDNSTIIDADKINPNYKITGNKIGRVALYVTDSNKLNKVIYVNVVNSDKAIASAKVENGDGFTVALRANGEVYSFGLNKSGQLGINSTEDQNAPVKIENSENIVDISTGKSHTLLLDNNGNVYTFGTNTNGQLGTGNTTTYKAPTKIELNNVIKVVAKENTSFAITSDGKIYAWGEGYTKSPKELEVTSSNNEFTKVIDISKNYFLAEDGIVRKLSDQSKIELSSDNSASNKNPTIVNTRVVQISESNDMLVMLGEDGRVYTYGTNTYGELGDGTTVSQNNLVSTIVKVEDGNILENVKEVSAGYRYAVAVTTDNRVYTWGINSKMQLGESNVLETGGIQESHYAILKEDVKNVERVSAGIDHTSIYEKDGNVYTWGNGENGQLGNASNFTNSKAQLVGKTNIVSNTTEILLEEGDSFEIDSQIDYFNLFTKKEADITYEILDPENATIDSTSGKVVAVKEGRTAVIAKEKDTEKTAVIPVRVLAKGSKSDNVNILIEPQVLTAGNHTVMLKTNGTVWTYGIGNDGELGLGDVTQTDNPEKVDFGDGVIITKIATGENHTLALDSEGNVWSFGKNNFYQLGNETDEKRTTPIKISGLSNITDIACGSYSSFAINKKGEVYSFGLNANGEGGVGSYTNKIPVTKAKYVQDAIDIKAGKNHTIILKSTGEVYATGSNLYGELGVNKDTTRSNLFTKVSGLDSVVSIDAGKSNNTAITKDGEIYVWGENNYSQLGITNKTKITEPTKISGLSDIRYISGLKGNKIAIDKNNQVYVNGLNSRGELGNGSNSNVTTFEKLSTITNVMQVSAGDSYTVMLKPDGTVWACGDYTNNNEDIISKTKSTEPIQVGNGKTTIGQTEITVKVNETKKLIENASLEFNLIKEEDDYFENLNYNCLNTDIVETSEDGNVTGKRVGRTRVTATSTEDGKSYSVLVNVVDENSKFAPKVTSGEDFVATLKSDGSVYTFGYNADGRLGIGNKITQTIPQKTNVLSTYKDVKAGNNFIIALRNNGTVWSTGNNEYAQLGNNNNQTQNKFSQIQNIKNIEQIAAGENFAVAVDIYGIVYGWGLNSSGELGNSNIGETLTKPTKIYTSNEPVINLSAGKGQTVLVKADGTVYGIGSLLNGEMTGMKNAVKTEVANGTIYVLTNDYEVYKYKDGALEKISIDKKIIDISAKGDSIMYQTSDELTYVSGDNSYGKLGTANSDEITTPEQINKNLETYSIATGNNNTYVIDVKGSVYASGNNEYGNLGNGTRDNSNVHVLVGDRNFEIATLSKTMSVGDVDTVQITGDTFNVFGNTEVSSSEFTFTNDAENVVSLSSENSTEKITANQEGTAHILVTDPINKNVTTLTRVVVAQDKDRIDSIKVNNTDAELDSSSTENDLKYKVQIVTNEDKANLVIKTKNATDRISIDDGETWSNNGTLSQEIDVKDKTTTFKVTVGIQNNEGNYPTEETYTLTVNKITDDVQIKEISTPITNSDGTQTKVIATAISSNEYEMAIDSKIKTLSLTAITNSKYSEISIDGKKYTVGEQTADIVIGNDESKEVTIIVKSENGTEEEYTLYIYRDTELKEIYGIINENKAEATKENDGTYTLKVPGSQTALDVTAVTRNANSKVQINNTENYVVNTDTENITLTGDVTKVSIKVQSESGTTEKEYTLNIVKKSDNTNLEKVTVNDEEVTLGDDGKYHYTLTYVIDKVTVNATTEDENANVKIDSSSFEQHKTSADVSISSRKTTTTITVESENGTQKEYELVIETLPDDCNIEKVEVNGALAKYFIGENRYEVRSNDTSFKIDVTLSDSLATLILGSNEEKTGSDSITVTKQGEGTTTVKVIVTSENKLETEEYEIDILEKSSNANLDTLKVNGVSLVPDLNGKYTANIKHNVTSINIEATAEDQYAITKIGNNDNSTYVAKMSDTVTDDKNIYTYEISVQSEIGTTNTYELEVTRLEANTNISSIKVGTEEQSSENALVTLEKDESGNYYYKMDRKDIAYVMVELESQKSTTTISRLESDGTLVETKTQGQNATQVLLPNEKNAFIVAVTGEDGTTKNYNLIIEKKSNDTSIKAITGEKIKEVEMTSSGARVYVDEDETTVDLTITLNNENGKLKLEDETEYTAKAITKFVTLSTDTANEGNMLILDIEAEDGTTSDYLVTITKKANLELQSVSVNSEGLTYDTENSEYFALVTNQNKPQITITAKNSKQKVDLLNSSGTVLATGTGTLTTTQTLSTSQLTDNYSIKITSHNGEDYGTQTYPLRIRQKSTETGITYVKVDNLGTTLSDDKLTYSSTVAGKDTYPLEIKLKDENAKVKLIDDSNNILINYMQGTLTGNISIKDGETNTYTMSVMAENGEQSNYKLSVGRASSNTEIESITITDQDEVEATDTSSNTTNDTTNDTSNDTTNSTTTETTTYTTKTVNVTNYNADTKTYKIIVNKDLISSDITIKAKSSFTKIKVESNEQTEKLELTKKLNALGTTKIEINLTAADGTEETRYLEIVKLNDSIGLDKVTVDGAEIQANDTKDYETTITDESSIANITATTVDEKAQVSINSGDKTLKTATAKIEKRTSRKISIPITVIAEDGTMYTYSLTLNIISHDSSVSQINVESEKASVDDEKYIAYIDRNLTQAEVEITSTSSYATIIVDNNGTTEQANGILKFTYDTSDLNVEEYNLTFKVVAEDGTEQDYELELKRKSDDATLKEIYVNGNLVKKNEDGKYVYSILDTDENPTVKAITNNEFAHVRIKLGNEYLNTAEQKVEMTESKETIIPITVRSQAGTTVVTDLYLEKISTSTKLSSVMVDDNNPDYYNENTNTYRFIIYNKKDEYELSVITENSYTILNYNGKDYENSFKDMIKDNNAEFGITVKFTIKSESGKEEECTVEIVYASDNTDIKQLKVNDVERTSDEESNSTYTVQIGRTDTEAKIEAKTVNTFANIRIGDNETTVGTSTLTVNCNDLTQLKIIVPIVVTATNGNTKTYNVVLERDTGTYISGKITNENATGKYVQNVKIYRQTDNELIVDTQTKEDGTFKQSVYKEGFDEIIDSDNNGVADQLESKYTVVVSKDGYLSYTVTDIGVTKFETTKLDEYKLIAGDVVKDNEIEIDDLTDLNDNIGVVITDDNKSEKSIYDLNEDGTIDKLDRNILKKNYGKKAKTVKWVNPEVGLIKPITTEYVITSKYGMRKNPVTGETKLHSGIDIVGEHHTPIIAVADGEITYAGVQNGYGNCVEIKHTVNGETIYSFYGHLSRIDVKVGDTVTKAQTIGLEGGASTDENHGTSTGHHLHFEIRTASGSGHSVDPSNYIEF